jgi:hypothetical protein
MQKTILDDTTSLCGLLAVEALLAGSAGCKRRTIVYFVLIANVAEREVKTFLSPKTPCFVHTIHAYYDSRSVHILVQGDKP